MKKPIGFLNFGKEQETEECTPTVPYTETAVKSVAQIRFASGRTLPYYNDRFALKRCDVVYVSGKLAGAAGVATEVNTKFRIHSADYERVIAVLDLTLHGSFTQACDKMVCTDPQALSPDRFESWVFPPNVEELDEEQDEVFTGEGYTIELDHIGGCEDLKEVILERAVGYCNGGNVACICLQDGIGRAYVEGTKWYRIDFRYADGVMAGIFCDCPYGGLCKHEVAAAITLRMLLDQMADKETFIALDRNVFWQLASRSETITL